MRLAAKIWPQMAVMIGLGAVVIVLGLATTSSDAEAAGVGYEGAATSVVTSEFGVIAGGSTDVSIAARWLGQRFQYEVMPRWIFCGLNAIESWLSGNGYWDGFRYSRCLF